MKTEELIEGVKNRILSEQRKHQGGTAWAKIAAHKIVHEYLDTQSENIKDIKLKWQKHNRDNGMSWNEVAELVNELTEPDMPPIRSQFHDIALDVKQPPPSEAVDDGDTVAVQKQTDGSYHLACQNCGTTKQPLQMIPFRNDNHVVGLLTACDECRDELYGQRFDRETKFPHPSEQERYVKQALDMVIEEEQRLSQERYDKGKSHLLRFYNSHEISQAHWDALKIASGKK